MTAKATDGLEQNNPSSYSSAGHYFIPTFISNEILGIQDVCLNVPWMFPKTSAVDSLKFPLILAFLMYWLFLNTLISWRRYPIERVRLCWNSWGQDSEEGPLDHFQHILLNLNGSLPGLARENFPRFLTNHRQEFKRGQQYLLLVINPAGAEGQWRHGVGLTTCITRQRMKHTQHLVDPRDYFRCFHFAWSKFNAERESSVLS